VSWTSWILAGLIAATLVAMGIYRARVVAEAKKLAVFLGEVRGEVEKVTWPDKEQLRNATLVILVFVTVVALLIGALDLVLQWILVTLPGRG
jgi:preprotein translocase subunit SecE